MKVKHIPFYYLLLSILCLCFSSCATLLNKPSVTVNFHSNKPVNLVLFKDTLIANEHQKAKLVLPRSKNNLDIIIATDSLQEIIPLESKSSAAYKLNLLFTSWLGMLLEHRNPKIYTYPKNIYLNVTDSIIHFSRRQLLHQPGELFFHFSFPYINHFHLQPEAEDNAKNSFGFMGVSAGVDYYHHKRQYISLKANAVLDFFIPVPVPVHYSGEYTVFNSSYLSLSNNHKWERWSLGYGISVAKNTWNFRYSDRSDPPAPTRIPVDRSHWAMGLVLPIYYQKGPNFHFGLIYRPSFYRWDLPTAFKYEHLISLDFAWKIRVR